MGGCVDRVSATPMHSLDFARSNDTHQSQIDLINGRNELEKHNGEV